MDSFTVDIGTKILPPDHEVYVARPGKAYRLYPDMVLSKLVFPELPLLDLTKGVPLANQAEIAKRIRRSVAIRSWHNAGRQDDKVPSRSLEDYSDDGGSPRVAQFLGILRGYFERAKKGDLVIVPPSAYSQDCYIGEFTTEATDFVKHRVEKYGDDYLTARAVQWLATVQRRRLPTAVLEAIEKPTVFFLLDRPSRKFIYERAYGSYSFSNEYNSGFEVTSPNFKTTDDFLIQAFFNFVTANTVAISEGRESEVKGLFEAAFADLGQDAPDLRTNVNSPGVLNLTAINIAPIVASVLLAIAVTIGPEAVAAAENSKITIGNKLAPPGDPCTAEVHSQVIKQIQLLGLDRWPLVCEKVRLASQRTGLKGRATVQEN